MKALDHQRHDTVNETQRNPALRIWRGSFRPEFSLVSTECAGGAITDQVDATAKKRTLLNPVRETLLYA